MSDLYSETSKTFFEYILKLDNASRMIADYLRNDNIGEAIQIIKQFVEGTSWVINIVQLMQQNGYSFNRNVEEINEFLQEINGGLEIQDFVLVADLFEYEIAPFFELMKGGKFLEVKDV